MASVLSVQDDRTMGGGEQERTQPFGDEARGGRSGHPGLSFPIRRFLPSGYQAAAGETSAAILSASSASARQRS